MFSIYGVTGQVFRGTLEEMNRARLLSRTQSARAIAQDGDELGVEAISGVSRQATDAYRSLLPRDLERGPLYHAVQIMQRKVISVLGNDDVASTWRTLRDNNIHQAPVLDSGGQLIGIVSERDLLTSINIDEGKVVDSLARSVRDVMLTPVVTAVPVTDIRRIATVMLNYGVAGVPILNDGGLLVGFVSRSDILRAVVIDPPLSLWC